MWKRFWREYFAFPRKERRGIYVLLAIMLLVFGLRIYLNNLWQGNLSPISTEFIYLDEEADKALIVRNNNTKIADINEFSSKISIDSASENQLIQVGFSKFQAKVLCRFIEKGGKVFQETDLLKVFGMDPKTILIVGKHLIFSKKSERPVFQKYFQLPEARKNVSINVADSATIDSLPWVSSALAGRIFKYRNRIGGFRTKEQMKEVFGLDTLVLNKMSSYVIIDSSKINFLLLNSIEEKQLAQNPYIGYKLAKIIINYRKQHGPFKSKSDLKNIILMNEEIFRKIEKYILLQ